MKKSTLIAGGASALMSLAVTPAVSAEPAPYFGGNATFLEYSADNTRGKADLTAANIRLGSTFEQFIAAEIRAGIGLTDDNVSFLGTNVNVDLDHFFGAYLRGIIPVSEQFHAYAVIGATRGKVSFSSGGFSDSETESDFSFGVGADVWIARDLALNIEYMNYLDKDAADVSGYSIGLVKRF